MKKTMLLFLMVWISGCSTEEAKTPTGSFKVSPYLQFATQQSMVVLWETDQPATTLVEFGEAQFNVDEAVLDQERTVEGYSTMHEIVLDGLKTETNYFYRVTSITESGEQIVSEVYPFKTAVEDESAYMFALVGDSQKNNDTPWAWERIAELVFQDRPNFVVHVGDLVDDGNRLTDWTEHFFPGGNILMSKTAMYTALGNHENDADYYYQYFHNPPPEYYYTFNYGNAQFFIVDTNRDVTEGSEQYTWLEWELAKSEATWKIVLHHHPPYSSEENDHGDAWHEASTMGTHARNLVPLYEQYGVDFNLFGHTHVYERTWPLKENLVNMQEGVIYINSGGAGGFLEDFAPTRNWFTADTQTGHHYCTFSIYDRTLVFKAIDSDGKMFDTFQMEKPLGDSKAEVIQPPAPKIFPMGGIFEGSQEVSMQAVFEDLQIRYTLDGSEPDSRSPLYTAPISINESATIRARTFNKEGKVSRISRSVIRKVEPLDPVSVSNTIDGVSFKYYELENDLEKLPDFNAMTPKNLGMVSNFSIDEVREQDEDIAITFEGFIQITESGRYTFYSESDDGSKVFIHNQEIVDNDGDHGMREREGDVILNEGLHPIRVEFYQGGGGFGLNVSFKGPSQSKIILPDNILKSAN